jgi:hypothetical protein
MKARLRYREQTDKAELHNNPRFITLFPVTNH